MNENAMEMFKNIPVLLCKSQTAWHAWLDKHHDSSGGIWLKLAKQASSEISVSYAEALEEALCYGWIDSQKQAYDSDYWLQRFAPRKPASLWSKVNVAKVEALTKTHKMQPSGLAAVEAAKQAGTWQKAYDSASSLTIPEDFQAALDKNPAAKQFFATLNKTNTYAFCWRIQTAKKSTTRQARIEKFINMLNKGEKIYP